MGEASNRRERDMAERRLGKRDKDEGAAGADIFLHPGGGGLMIWVRRDELLPRAAIRFRAKKPGVPEDINLEEGCTLLAALEVARERLIAQMAAMHGVDPKTFAAMCATALDVLRPKFMAVTEVRTGGQEPTNGTIPPNLPG